MPRRWLDATPVHDRGRSQRPRAADGTRAALYAGGFTVVGDGSGSANGSGGTVQKTSGNSITLTGISGSGISLRSMIVKNAALSGISGSNVNNVALLGCQILTNGTSTATDNGVKLVDTTGAVTFTGTTVSGSKSHNVFIGTSPASTASLSALTVNNGASPAASAETVFS